MNLLCIMMICPHSTDTFDVEPQRVTVQVEHLDEKNVIVDNDVVAPDAQVNDNVNDAPDTCWRKLHGKQFFSMHTQDLSMEMHSYERGRASSYL